MYAAFTLCFLLIGNLKLPISKSTIQNNNNNKTKTINLFKLKIDPQLIIINHKLKTIQIITDTIKHSISLNNTSINRIIPNHNNSNPNRNIKILMDFNNISMDSHNIIHNNLTSFNNSL